MEVTDKTYVKKQKFNQKIYFISSQIIINGDRIQNTWTRIAGNDDLYGVRLTSTSKDFDIYASVPNVKLSVFLHGSVRNDGAFTSAGSCLNLPITAPTTVAPLTNAPTITANIPTFKKCNTNTEGRIFYVYFLQNSILTTQPQLRLTIASAANSFVDLRVTTPGNPNLFSNSYRANKGEMLVVDLPSSIMSSGTGIRQNVLRIQALSQSDISIVAFSKKGESCGAFMIYPERSLGSNYLISAWWTPNQSTQYSVTATQIGNTQVTMKFPMYRGIQVSYNGRIFTARDNFQVTLSQYQTMQVQALVKGDLSGTRITATNKVAVFSGNVDTSVGYTGITDHIVAQIPPSTVLGKDYVIPTTPRAGSRTVVKFIGQEDNTYVRFGAYGVRLEAQDHYQQILRTNDFVRISSNKPVLVTVMAVGTSSPSNEAGMQIIPSVRHYRYKHVFTIPQILGADHYLSLIVPTSHRNNVIVDGRNISGSVIWQNVALIEGLQGESMSGTHYKINAGFHFVYIQTSISNVAFTASVYTTSSFSKCGYSFAAGFCVEATPEV